VIQRMARKGISGIS